MPEYFFDRGPRPASYEQPNVNFDWLGNLPKAYQEGQQYGRLRQQQTAFQNGLPIGPDGQPDIGAIIAQISRTGGAEAAAGQIPNLIKQRVLNEDEQQGWGGPGTGQPAVQPQPPSSMGAHPYMSGQSNNGAGPSNITPNSTATNQKEESDSLTSLASSVFGDMDASPYIKSVATKMQVDPGAPLDPTRLNLAKQLLGREKLKLASASQDVSSLQGSPGPSQAIGPAASSPAPPNTPQGNTVVAQAPTQGGAPSAARAMVPAGVRDPQSYADALQRRAEGILRKVDRREIVGIKADGAKAAAQADIDKAKQIREALAKEGEAEHGISVKAREEVQKGNIARGEKAYTGINAADQQFQRDIKPLMTVARSILNNPEMYSGFGADRRLNFERIKTAMGGDPRTAQLMEMLQKVTASSVLGVINTQKDQMEEAGSNSGRLFKQQVELVEKAAAAPGTTLPGNRSLVEIQLRMGELGSRVAEMARAYRRTHQYLDDGFDEQLSNYMKSHPVFTEQEQRHPELLGSPTAPPGFKNKTELQSWGKSLGVNSGDAYRTPTGQIKALP